MSRASRQGARPPAAEPTAPSPAVDHFAQAQSALNERRYDNAASEANLAIGARQRPLEARNLLGLAYIRLGQRAQAVSQWRLVLARDAGNAQARSYLHAAGEDPDPH
jgi:Flp pilus assembly protein TadD